VGRVSLKCRIGRRETDAEVSNNQENSTMIELSNSIGIVIARLGRL